MSNSKRLMQVLLVGCLLIAAATGAAADDDKRGRGRGQVVSVQVFTSQSSNSLGIPPTETKLLAPLFTYTKQSPISVLKVTYEDQISAGFVCAFQIRIDDTSSQPGNAFSAPILIVSQGASGTRFSSAGAFTGLPAGPHELSIWFVPITNVLPGCTQNSGRLTTTVIVEELEPLIPTDDDQ